MSDYLSTENQVACLAQAIRNGEYPSIAEATRENPDLYSRVKYRVAGRTSRSDRPATNRLLSDTEEEGIMLWITRLNDIGQRPSISLLERFVNRILVDRHTDPTKPPRTCGTKWATRFCKRRKVILKTEVPKEAKRQAAEDPLLVKEWFNALGRDIKKYAVQHKDIYNMDESGIHIGQGKKEKVLVIHNKAARCEAGKAFSRESATITETIYADGHVIPPLIIFKGKTHQMR
jgi:Tc5 transposase DNA-binding domain